MDLDQALFALAKLDDLPRTGWILAGVPQPESVAGHALGVAHLALACGPQESPPLDLEACLAMALVHDVAEARSGDLPRAAGQALPAGAKASMEQALAGPLLKALGPRAEEAWHGYQAQTTREARFVKACDRLQMGVQAVSRLRGGQRGLQDFGRGLEAGDWSEFPTLQSLWGTLRQSWLECEDYRDSDSTSAETTPE